MTSAASPPQSVEPRWAELAAAHGVATSYADWQKRPVVIGRPAVVSALAALGVDASTADAVDVSIAELEDAPWRRLLPPSVVLRGTERSVPLRVPEVADVELHVELEDGGRVLVPVPSHAGERRGDRVLRTVELPRLPLGWHRLVATATGTATTGTATAAVTPVASASGPQAPAGAGRRPGSGLERQERDEAVLVVAPDRIELPTGLDRAWGWMLQLYSLRSAGSWGVGDYADLRTVVETSRKDGAGAVLLNPLHAETPVLPLNPSPYSPSSRRFRSALYLRVEDVPEHAAAPAEVREAVAALRPATDPDRVERDPAWRAKLAALELLWPLHRAEDLAAYRAGHGRPLAEFAVFCVLTEQHGSPWQDWPEQLRRPDAPAVAAAAEQHADRVAFWCWVQLLVDEQLAGLGAGMAVGVVHDLAVGVDAGGADAWALQDVLALGTTVGAPPDSFNQQGQDWGLPPWRPDRLREAGYAPFRDMVRGCLRHAGGLRIDHVMGLFRLWWVPAGSPASDGTYVSYDSDALLGILALEASRAGALVVGEDLGTVEDRVRTDLDATGVLGSAVLWFERDEDSGDFVPPEQWRSLALATVTTHDLPTAAGFLAAEQVRVRDELGQLGVPVEQEQARVQKEQDGVRAMLTSAGLLERYGDPALAMHGALVASPCRLVLAALGDAVGDLRQPNLPGTVDQYPNWRLPVADGAGRPLGLEELLASDGVRRLTALLAEGVAAGGPGSDSLPSA